MKIIKTSENLTAKDTYFLTQAPDAHKMQELEGSEVDMAAYAMYEDDSVNKDTGEVETKLVLSIKTPEDEVFGTISPTFIRDFSAMIDCFANFGETVHRIAVITGTSNKGRKFITCRYVG